MIIFLVTGILIILSICFFLFLSKRGSSRSPTPKTTKERGGKRKIQSEVSSLEKTLVLNSLQINWNDDEVNLYTEKLRKEDFLPILLRMKYKEDFVSPSRFQSSATFDENFGSDSQVDESTFDRFVYQPFFQPSFEKLYGVVRFNDRCCGPCKINDNLEFDAVNGGASISFGIEMIQFFSTLVEQDIPIGRNTRFIDDKYLEKCSPVKEIEIEYVQPIPLNKTNKFECSKDKNDPDRVEVTITNFGIGSRKTIFCIVRGRIYKDEDEEMYSIQHDDEDSSSSYDEEALESLKKDELPELAKEELRKLQHSDHHEFVHVDFYETLNPEEFDASPSGICLLLHGYFIASKGNPLLYGDKNLLDFKYANVAPYFDESRMTMECVVYFGEETADPKNRFRVHQGIVSAILDNYAALHLACCVKMSKENRFSCFTKVLNLTYFPEISEIKRYEAVKFKMKYVKKREIMILGNRKAIYGDISGVCCSIDDEKRKFVEMSSIWTAIQVLV